MLRSYEDGNKKMFRANATHPLFKEVTALVKKYVGIDVLILNVASRLGDLQKVYLTGELAKGVDSQIIDLILVGTIDKIFFLNLIDKTEKLLKKKIRFVIYSPSEAVSLTFHPEENLLLWQQENE